MKEKDRLKQAFGSVIGNLRDKKGVSQKEVADNCGLERAYISRLERGIAQPTIATVFKLADYFKTEPADLISQVSKITKKRTR